MRIEEFLLARIAEDEDFAIAATSGDGYREWSSPSTGVVEVAGGDLDGLVPTTRDAANHIVRHDPARVLADCEAKRQLIAWLQRLDDRATDNNWWTIETTEALAILALPYADHPDYREEWRP